MSDVYELIEKAGEMLEVACQMSPSGGSAYREAAAMYLQAAELLVRVKEAS